MNSENNERVRNEIHPSLVAGEQAVRENEAEETKFHLNIEHSQDLIEGYWKAVEMRDEKFEEE